jgi:hypothetical protein
MTVPKLIAAKKITGRIVSTLSSARTDKYGFVSSSVPALDIALDGVAGSRHVGWTRGADARVPYLPRGTTIRNQRHLSIVSVEDLAEIARRLDIPGIEPATIGASLAIEGIPHFSYLPRGARLFVDGGAILIVEDQNAPCRLAGIMVAEAHGHGKEMALAFAKLAKGLRGVVATAEHPGRVTAPATVTARIPEQWIYA